jgi:hypothetical protein
MSEWGVSKEMIERAYAKAEQVAKELGSQQKQIAQEILAELAKREKGVWV